MEITLRGYYQANQGDVPVDERRAPTVDGPRATDAFCVEYGLAGDDALGGFMSSDSELLRVPVHHRPHRECPSGVERFGDTWGVDFGFEIDIEKLGPTVKKLRVTLSW